MAPTNAPVFQQSIARSAASHALMDVRFSSCWRRPFLSTMMGVPRPWCPC